MAASVFGASHAAGELTVRLDGKLLEQEHLVPPRGFCSVPHPFAITSISAPTGGPIRGSG